MAISSAAVVALKPLRSAKSRLQGVPAAYREHIAWCLAHDTIEALAASVDRVIVVSNEPSLPIRLRHLGHQVEVHPEGPSLGMNAALAAGASEFGGADASIVVACVGDLPCLRPDTVRRLIAAAAHRSRCYVADASGNGTTMLFARGVSLDPRFQGMSASAHRGSGAVPLTEVDAGPLADARRDVDTLADLVDGARIGLGSHTAGLFDARHRLGRFESVTVVEPGMVATAEGAHYRLDPPSDATHEDVPSTTPGQRLHAALGDDRVLSFWR